MCAHALLHPDLQTEIAQCVQKIQDWEAVILLADSHSLSPLLYHHLIDLGVTMPTPIKRQLLGISLQHKRANDIRAAALGEILSALENKGIRALVLKGAALAHWVYPDPGLRPMRDLDILVAAPELAHTRATLIQLGYHPELAGFHPLNHHHLPPLARQQMGINISVEIHHQLFPATRHYHTIGYNELITSCIPFKLHEQTAYTLGYEDMLWHIYRHSAGPPLLTIPFKWIYIADIVSLVEKYAAQIDWERLNRSYPQVLRILPLLNFLTPWSPEIQSRFGWTFSSPPQAVGEEYGGWPRHKLSSLESIQDTFSPPEWWLRFFYGIGMDRASAFLWHKWVRHPYHILEWGISTFLDSLQKHK